MSNPLKKVTMFRGDSYPLELTIKNKATGDAVPLTGFSFIMTVTTIKDPPDDTTVKFTVIGVIDPDQVANMGKVTFTPTTDNTDEIGKFFYDVQMTNASGHIRTIAKNNFDITQDNTK